MAGLRRTSRRLLIVVALSATTALMLATPAGAWLRDFESTQVLTPSNSVSPKSLQFVCPGQKQAIGAGATIPFISNLAINKMWVLFGQRAALTAAAETDSEAVRWALTTRAWCTTQTAVRPTLATAAPYVKNVTIERNQSSSNSNSPKTVEARCPAGTARSAAGCRSRVAANQVATESVQRLAIGPARTCARDRRHRGRMVGGGSRHLREHQHRSRHLHLRGRQWHRVGERSPVRRPRAG